MILICCLITGILVLAVICCVSSFVNSKDIHLSRDSKPDQSYWYEILKKYLK